MQAPFSPSKFQGMIQQYWGDVYNQNQDGLKSLLSPDIEVESEVTFNGVKQPVEKFGLEKLLEVASKAASTIKEIRDTSQKYCRKTFNQTPNSATIELVYDQELLLNENGKDVIMKSKGKQIWTTDKTVLTALKVFETDITKTPVVNENENIEDIK